MTPIDLQERLIRKNATQGMRDADARLWVQSNAWGRVVRHARHAQGWTLDDLAQVLYLDKGTIARYETGQRACEYAIACQMADALGCPDIERYAAWIVLSRLRRTSGPEVA